MACAERGCPDFNQRDVTRNWSIEEVCKDAKLMGSVCKELCELGWIKKVKTNTREKRWLVNPILLDTIGTIGSATENTDDPKAA